MYGITADDEAKRVQFFKDLDSAVEQMKVTNNVTVHDLNIVSDFSKGTITLESMKDQLKYSEQTTIRLKERLIEIDRADVSNGDKIQKSIREMERVTRAPSDITKADKDALVNFIKGDINQDRLNLVVRDNLDKRNEYISRIVKSYDQNITEPSLRKSYAASAKNEINEAQEKALSDYARGVTRGELDKSLISDATEQQTQNYKNLRANIFNLHKKSPSQEYKEKLSEISSDDLPKPQTSTLNEDPKPAAPNSGDGPKSVSPSNSKSLGY